MFSGRKFNFLLAFTAGVLAYVSYALMFRFVDYLFFLGASKTTGGFVVSLGIVSGIAARLFTDKFRNRLGTSSLNIIANLLIIGSSSLFIFCERLSPLLILARITFCAGSALIILLPTLVIQETTTVQRQREVLSVHGISAFIGIILGSTISDIIFLTIPESSLRFQTLMVLSAAVGGLNLLVTLSLYRPPRLKAVSLRPRTPLSFKHSVSRLTSKPIVLIGLALGVNFLITTAYLSPFLQARNIAGGFSIFFIAYALSTVVFQYGTRHWGYYFSHFKLIILGIGAIAFGITLLVLVSKPWHLCMPALAYGFGRAMAYPSLLALCGSEGHANASNTISTPAMLAVIEMGILLFAPFFGLIADQLSYEALLLSSGCITVLLASIWWRFEGREQKNAQAKRVATG